MFITLYFVLYYFDIKLEKKLIKADVQVFLTDLTAFCLLTNVINLSVFFPVL